MDDRQDKAARLAEKLRENLRKRKAQARGEQPPPPRDAKDETSR